MEKLTVYKHYLEGVAMVPDIIEAIKNSNLLEFNLPDGYGPAFKEDIELNFEIDMGCFSMEPLPTSAIYEKDKEEIRKILNKNKVIRMQEIEVANKLLSVISEIPVSLTMQYYEAKYDAYEEAIRCTQNSKKRLK